MTMREFLNNNAFVLSVAAVVIVWAVCNTIKGRSDDTL